MNTLKEKRRLEIIQAALEIFAIHGYHKAKMQDIAKVAGIGKGTIYEYFDSKRDLFEKMIFYIVDSYLKGARQSLLKGDRIETKLLSFTKYHGDFLDKHINIGEVIMLRSDSLSSEIKEWLKEGQLQLYNLMIEIIQQAKSMGEIKKDLESETAALAILGTIDLNYRKRIYFDKGEVEGIDPVPIITLLLKGMEHK